MAYLRVVGIPPGDFGIDETQLVGAIGALITAAQNALAAPDLALRVDPTGLVAVSKASATATVLADGRVLFAGGLVPPNPPFASSDTAEIYDPATGLFAYTGSLNVRRRLHAAVLLNSGKVFLCGGTSGPPYTTICELFDPATGTFTPTVGVLSAGRRDLTATLLQDGRVLVVGGYDGANDSDRAEIYDPATDLIAVTGSLATSRNQHSATLLPSGKVLVAGGDHLNVSQITTEIYDPATGLFTAGTNMTIARARPTPCLLPSGLLIFTGSDDAGGVINETSEVYYPVTNIVAALPNRTEARDFHFAVPLPSGQVMVLGGYTTGVLPLSSIEVFTPWTNAWQRAGSLRNVTKGPQGQANVVVLHDGRILVVGGPNREAQLITPGAWG